MRLNAAAQKATKAVAARMKKPRPDELPNTADYENDGIIECNDADNVPKRGVDVTVLGIPKNEKPRCLALVE